MPSALKSNHPGKFCNRLWLIFYKLSIPVAAEIKSCDKAFFGFEKISKTDPSSISSPFLHRQLPGCNIFDNCIYHGDQTNSSNQFLFQFLQQARICLVVFGSRLKLTHLNPKSLDRWQGHAIAARYLACSFSLISTVS